MDPVVAVDVSVALATVTFIEAGEGAMRLVRLLADIIGCRIGNAPRIGLIGAASDEKFPIIAKSVFSHDLAVSGARPAGELGREIARFILPVRMLVSMSSADGRLPIADRRKTSLPCAPGPNDTSRKWLGIALPSPSLAGGLSPCTVPMNRVITSPSLAAVNMASNPPRKEPRRGGDVLSLATGEPSPCKPSAFTKQDCGLVRFRESLEGTGTWSPDAMFEVMDATPIANGEAITGGAIVAGSNARFVNGAMGMSSGVTETSTRSDAIPPQTAAQGCPRKSETDAEKPVLKQNSIVPGVPTAVADGSFWREHAAVGACTRGDALDFPANIAVVLGAP